MNELEQQEKDLKADYSATDGMADLQYMQLMLQSGRDELAVTCVNRVNAFLFRLTKN